MLKESSHKDSLYQESIVPQLLTLAAGIVLLAYMSQL